MNSKTVEFQRFGDPTGVIRLSDRYLRTIGDVAETDEVNFEVSQENFDAGMGALDYRRFESAGRHADRVTRAAEHFIEDISEYLERFLGGNQTLKSDGHPFQVDIVTHALELAQLPFEILEERDPDLIVTRRIRQPWPLPEVVYNHEPKVLFAWAEPRKRRGSDTRMTVPHERQLEIFDEILGIWGGVKGGAFVQVENATRAKLEAVLSKKENRFTHVHFLAHGIRPLKPRYSQRAKIDLTAKQPAPMQVALEKEDGGTIDRCEPEALAAIFRAAPLPETFTAATCFGAEVDSIRSRGTLAHMLHRAGIPVVVASQLALTEIGSDELIRTFLARVIRGTDPRKAVRECRDALRKAKEETYYDRVALISYVHIDGGYQNRQMERSFKVSLTELKSISKDAEALARRTVLGLGRATGPGSDPIDAARAIRDRFQEVRDRLEALEDRFGLNKAQREELWGLEGSSLKREAEAAWLVGRALSGESAEESLAHSRTSLEKAARAYRFAAEFSRDNHWSMVQFLVLEAIRKGSLEGHQDDWVAARLAARDATALEPEQGASEEERKNTAEQAMWGWGSLAELYLLAPLIGRKKALTEAKTCLERFVSASRAMGLDYAIDTTLAQLQRYSTWWGINGQWKLPTEIVTGAKELHDFLKGISS